MSSATGIGSRFSHGVLDAFISNIAFISIVEHALAIRNWRRFFLSDGLLHMDFCRQRHDASLLALLWSLEEENDHVYA